MYRIVDFTAGHIERARNIALQNYNDERGFVPLLPPVDRVPDLTMFAENGLGVAAFDGDEMVGFLCCVPPFKNAFRSTAAVGVFSPMGASGAVGQNRASVYARMYQAVGEKWAEAGAASHAVCLYTHDREVQEQFFKYGFGMRCVDAIRGLDEIALPSCTGYTFAELVPEEYIQVLPLDHLLDAHMASSPCFILRPSHSEASFNEQLEQHQTAFAVARQGGRIVAYIRAEQEGETFVCGTPGYLHINGAYCLPEHRGKGVIQELLNLLILRLKTQGYTRLGVDFESINPAAYSFWLKYFHPYTHGVVRRIDERAVAVRSLTAHAF